MGVELIYESIYSGLALMDSQLQIWTTFTFALIVAVHVGAGRIGRPQVGHSGEAPVADSGGAPVPRLHPVWRPGKQSVVNAASSILAWDGAIIGCPRRWSVSAVLRHSRRRASPP